VSPGGHFFGANHTLERFRDAFYAPFLSDWSNFEAWQANGAQSATERATPIWQSVLADYEPPGLDSARIEALEAFVAHRKEEIGSGEL
jgi:trimethylamine--corrinoid protein Co-methyltransferase